MGDLLLSILVSIGGTSVVLGGLFWWLGKRHLEKQLETERSVNKSELAKLQGILSKEIESHKVLLKYDEKFFDHLFKASVDLYKIRTEIVPEKQHPDMDWSDACEIMMKESDTIRNKLSAYLQTYYAALPPEIFEELQNAVYLCGDAKFSSNHEDSYSAINEIYDKVSNACKNLKSIVDDKRATTLITPYKRAKKK